MVKNDQTLLFFLFDLKPFEKVEKNLQINFDRVSKQS